MEELVRVFWRRLLGERTGTFRKRVKRTWTRCSQVNGIGLNGADTVGNLQQRALRSVFGDNQLLLKIKVPLYCIFLGNGLEESKVPIAEYPKSGKD